MAVVRAQPDLRSPDADTLVARDLAHILSVAGRPCIGPWEEEPPRRSGFAMLAQWNALDRGADFSGPGADRDAMLAARDRVAGLIAETEDGFGWRESIEAPSGRRDAGTVLAILAMGRTEGAFAIDAPRVLATVEALQSDFAALYPINDGRAVPAVGRWAEDVFFGGNPWYPVTLGFAELHYRIAALRRDRTAFDKADAWMDLVRQVAPEGDALPEQFDRANGAPTSCHGLTWSAAAFIGAAGAREAAFQAMAR